MVLGRYEIEVFNLILSLDSTHGKASDHWEKKMIQCDRSLKESLPMNLHLESSLNVILIHCSRLPALSYNWMILASYRDVLQFLYSRIRTENKSSPASQKTPHTWNRFSKRYIHPPSPPKSIKTRLVCRYIFWGGNTKPSLPISPSSKTPSHRKALSSCRYPTTNFSLNYRSGGCLQEQWWVWP
jgi:hypothetical protein